MPERSPPPIVRFLRFLSCALVVGATTSATPHPFGRLDGTLLDASSERPIPGAEVRLTVNGAVRITDVNGRFSFGELNVAGPDTLVLRHISYDSLRLPIESEIADADLEFLLSPRPIELEGLNVRVNAAVREEAERLGEISDGYVWDRSDFESRAVAAMHIADPLRWSGKVASITEDAHGYRCVVMRAGHGCAQIMINNINVSPEVLDQYAPEDVQSYVIIDPINATTLYGTGAGAGVIVVYLRGR